VITLKFQTMQEAFAATVGPAPAFRVAGNFMRQLPEERVVAEYTRHQWRVKDRYFSRYDCMDPCLVHFSDVEGSTTERFGPFKELFVADGTLYADGKLFAKFSDETVLWHSFELETYWQNLVISAAF
jgi:hypothetical protein